MPQPDVPCTRCGKLTYRGGPRSISPLGRVCRPCRAIAPQPYALPSRQATRCRRCSWCGDRFAKQRPSQRYCSLACNNRAAVSLRTGSEARARRRTCEVCGKQYVATYTQQRACGRTCGKVLSQASRPRAAPRIRIPRPPQARIYYLDCVACGDLFVARCATARCCRPCLLSRRQGRDRHCACGAQVPGRARRCAACRREHRRRERRGYPISLAELAFRDRYRCGLCHRKVNLALVVPHPGAPTVDHVLPRSRGGTDEPVNLQLAHFLCNSRKGAALNQQQLALFG